MMPATRSIAALGAALLLGACAGSPPTRLYVLSSVPGASAPADAAATPARGVSIGPVSIPAYVDRPEIVTRQGPNQVSAATFDQWAGSLSGMTTATLVQDLAARMPRDRVFAFSTGAPQPADYRVSVAITRFDVDQQGAAVLAAHWEVYRRGRPDPAERGDTQAHVQAAGDGVDAHVAAMSRLLGVLADRIVEALSRIRPAAEPAVPSP